MSLNGHPIGGLKGSIKTLQKLINDFKPDRVIVCWDGPNGSLKRRQINKNYKLGRKPLRLNRSVREMTEEEEKNNKLWQQTRLIEYYNSMPVMQFMYENIEADDIISYVKSMNFHSGWQKIIVSSDKDFYQLLDNETILYRPVQKTILNKNNIIDEFKIHPRNFALARSLAGDKSDNIIGLSGVGLKSISKRFPFLLEDKDYGIDDLVEYSKSSEKELKIFSEVIDNSDRLKENYKITQLYSPYISAQTKSKIQETCENADLSFNATEIKKMMFEDGFGDINWSMLFQNLNRLSLNNS